MTARDPLQATHPLRKTLPIHGKVDAAETVEGYLYAPDQYSEDGTFDAFRKKVLANTITYQDGVLTYEDAKWGKMEFCPDPTRPADQWRRIDGEPVALPDKLFDSPYLTSDYASGVIIAEFNGRKLVLDFNANERRED